MKKENVVELDLHAVRSTSELHDLLKDRLNFPEWYGKNWDAFWDAVSGLVELPDVLVLVGWEDFSRHLPEDARQLAVCLKDLGAEYPDIAPNVIYA